MFAGWWSRSIATPGRCSSGNLFGDPTTPVRGTFRCRHKDGTHPLNRGRGSQSAAPAACLRGIVVHYRDVTTRKATEDQLKDHRRSIQPSVHRRGRRDFRSRCRAAASNSSIPRPYDYSSVTLDEILGRRFTEFIRADCRPQVLQHYRERQTSERRVNSYIEFPAITKWGKEIWLGQNAWIISDASGQAVGMQAVARDITEHRRAKETSGRPKRSTARSQAR